MIRNMMIRTRVYPPRAVPVEPAEQRPRRRRPLLPRRRPPQPQGVRLPGPAYRKGHPAPREAVVVNDK